MAEAEGRLKRFMADYQGSIYANELQFTLATIAMTEDSAEQELSKVNYRLFRRNIDGDSYEIGGIKIKKRLG